MDPRIRVEAILGELNVDRKNVYILRNAGGRAQEALRSIIVSQNLLGTTDIHVIHHEKCGMANNSEEGLRETLLGRLVPRSDGKDNAEARRTTMHQLAQYQFLPIRSDICVHRAADSVFNDMELLRNHPLIKKDTNIKGWLYKNIDNIKPEEHKLARVEAIPRPEYTPARADTCQRECCHWNCAGCPPNHGDK
ncbi:carbonate dehydratase, partial [Rhizoctonia solani AG-3 Rhs1AP]